MTKHQQPTKEKIGRREIMAGTVAVSLAVVLGNSRLTQAAAQSTTEITLATKLGGTKKKAAFAQPKNAAPHPGIILIHEWWGLNDQIKAVASSLAGQGYMALAIDLYDGKVATAPNDARAYMQAIDADDATETIISWADWLAAQPGCNGRLGSVRWCFGGGWSLNAGIVAPINGVVIYYGNVQRSSDELSLLNAPVLGHFATRDGWIDQDMITAFEAEMNAANKTYTTHWYEADHGFANPTSARYDGEDAQLAWQRTLEFFETVL